MNLAASPMSDVSPAPPSRLGVAIIGAGVAGVAMGRTLLDAGERDFAILEAGDGPGGVWRETRYPGVACDVPADLYGFSFAPNPDWSRRYAPGAEIERYVADVAAPLTGRIHYRSRVTTARWTGAVWRLHLAGQEPIDAEALVLATGALRQPNEPDLPGRESYRGEIHHTARWPEGLDLTGRRVALVGGGASAVQILPALAAQAAQVTLILRSPPWVLPVSNYRAFAPLRFLRRKAPGLHRAAIGFFGRRLQNQYGGVFTGHAPAVRRLAEFLCRRALRKVRDPALRQALTPDYALGCKRLAFSGAFYSCVQRPNVHVRPNAIVGLAPEGPVLADGARIDADLVVLATGYEARAFHRPLAVIGEDDETLADRWDEAPQALHGVTMAGFPNLFALLGPGSPLASQSNTIVAEWQAAHVRALLARARGLGRPVAPKRAAMARAREQAKADHARAVWKSGCTSWYLTAAGDPIISATPAPELRRALLAPDWSDYEFVAPSPVTHEEIRP